jgi:hypothetical protein
MPNKLYRNQAAHRLIVFPDNVSNRLFDAIHIVVLFQKIYYFQKKVPEKILKNISYQIRPQMPVIKRLGEYSPEEIKQVPRLFEW